MTGPKIPGPEGFREAAEWHQPKARRRAWPSHGDLWQESWQPAQAEFTALCRAIAAVDPATGQAQGEALHVLVPDSLSRQQAEKALAGLPVTFHDIGFGDIWLRDTAPIFLK